MTKWVTLRARLVIGFGLEGMGMGLGMGLGMGMGMKLDPFGCTFKGMVMSKYYNVWLHIQRNGNGN